MKETGKETGQYVLRPAGTYTKLEQYEFAKLTNDLGLLRGHRATVTRNNDVIVIKSVGKTGQPGKTGTYEVLQ